MPAAQSAAQPAARPLVRSLARAALAALVAGVATPRVPAAPLQEPAGPDPAAQDSAPRACDPRQVPWVLPADFERALDRAREERRILLVKGVSFGIDGLGATCGHKGRW